MDRTVLRKMLPYGSLKEVAKRAKVSPVSVSRFFKGDMNSYKIEISAMEIAEKYEKLKRELSSKLD